MRRTIPIVAAVLAMLATMLMVAQPAAADENAPIALAGCTTNVLPDGDDAFELADLGFDANIGDLIDGEIPTTSSDIWVSENGIVSFDAPVGYWFNGFDLEDVGDWFSFDSEFDGDIEVIAPLYIDAVRDGERSSVTYGQTIYQGRNAFCVEWNELTPFVPDFYDTELPNPLPTNSFQLLLVERTDVNSGDFDIIVNYETIGWDDGYCEQQFIGVALDDDIQTDDFQTDAIGGPTGNFNNCRSFGPPDPGLVAIEDDLVEVESAVFRSFENVGALAGVAFPSFGFGQNLEFPGSGFVLEMTDANGLAANTLNSVQQGRYIVELRDGFSFAELEAFSGLVTGPEGPIAGSLVSGCSLGGDERSFDCVTTRTNADGWYEFGGAPFGGYSVTAYAPPGSNLLSQTETFFHPETFGPDFNLVGPEPVAPGVSFGPTIGSGTNTTVYYGSDLDLAIDGCVGGTATWTLELNSGAEQTGTLTEGPDGSYSTTIPALRPLSGRGGMSLSVSCPDPTEDVDTGFSLYIDPAGQVLELDSREPLVGASVVLERRDLSEVEFTVVPDQSDIMDENNRDNESITDENGLFSWNVVPGEYRVTASLRGCEQIALPADWADRVLTSTDGIVGVPDASVTPVLRVWPEWLGLELFLDCNNVPTIEDPGPLSPEGPFGAEDLVAPAVDDLDVGDNLADGTLTVTLSRAPEVFPIYEPVDVTWTVTDDQGASAFVVQTITVTDTIAPEIVESSVTFEANSPAGWAYDRDALAASLTVIDAVDSAPMVSCATLTNVENPEVVVSIPVGTPFDVRCPVEDFSGNTAQPSVSVIAIDTTSPELSLPELAPVLTENVEGTNVSFDVSASDIVDTEVEVVCTPASGSFFEVGPTTVGCTATDDSGNEDTGSFEVVVVNNADTEAPLISAPSDFSVAADSAEGSIVTFEVTATDNVDEFVEVFCTPESGSNFAAGTTTTVICTATDTAQNTGSFAFNVTVEAFVAPAEGLRARVAELATAVSELDGLTRYEQRRVDRAVIRLVEADQDRKWVDGNTLTERRGYRAMTDLRYAVLQLENVDGPEAAALSQDILDVMSELAQSRIDQARADGGWSFLIWWAESQFDRAESRRDDGRTTSAAYYYRSAWFLAKIAS